MRHAQYVVVFDFKQKEELEEAVTPCLYIKHSTYSQNRKLLSH